MTINNNPGLRSWNWNENNLNPLTRNNWRASLVPAAAVIPAPIAYIKVVAVKKLVVGFQETHLGNQFAFYDCYCEKIRVFQTGNCRNTLAWNNECIYNLVDCIIRLIGTVGALVFNCQR